MSRNASTADATLALVTLELNLEAEHWFLEQVRSRIDENCSRKKWDSLRHQVNHDFLIHLAQFLFLFGRLEMSDRISVGSFVDLHSEKIRADIRDGKVDPRFEKEKRKAIFSDLRKLKVTESCAALGRPAFAITELAHFLTDFMSEKTASSMISDLVSADVLERVDDPRASAAPDRKLIVSPGFLENTYAESLLRARAGILATASGLPRVPDPTDGPEAHRNMTD